MPHRPGGVRRIRLTFWAVRCPDVQRAPRGRVRGARAIKPLDQRLMGANGASFIRLLRCAIK